MQLRGRGLTLVSQCKVAQTVIIYLLGCPVMLGHHKV